ncbi:hypothetical protein H327_01515 [Vibrio parahaemolyticus 3324]|nr:hypothetical protein M636_10145 [Vibrio parahaemolyticus O1:K33 str. CDC_K4557]KIS87658.1 hypothetical protein H321_01515 [Vibrio parahaemolyticus 97-10290]KIS94563.1 hypothetical protein H338_01515 [Vibrio parahaemolyticus EN9701173]KIT00571.1 hypothetical protein H333_01515 [Vibrio parahaemolyticus 12315]KIT06271.1 hypothetical protein H324_01515 [Vibrio parahaemolyticus 846]KIT08680.1 hypothetical protein H327_01515 [Vibrio parahaemolyticus 3324]KIT12002.1 hypothetical protein H339_0151
MEGNEDINQSNKMKPWNEKALRIFKGLMDLAI